MKKTLICSLAAAMALTFAPMSAQAQQAWSLQDCISYALANNIQLKKNAAATQTADVELKRTKAAWLPSLNASTTQGVTYRPFQDTGSSIVNGGITQSAADKATQSGSYGVNASWTVWDGGQRTLNIQNAELSRSMTELDAQTTANSLQEQITQLYVQILYTQEAARVNQQLLAQDSVVYERGRQMVAQGQMSRADLAQLSAQVSAGRYDVVNTEMQITSLKTQLKQLLELDPTADIDIAQTPVTDAQVLTSIPSKIDVYQQALESRPEMQRARLASEQSVVNTKIAKAGWSPSVSLTGGLGDSHLTGTSTDYFKQMKQNFNASLGVSVTIPILDNRQTKSAVEKARIAEVTSQLDELDTQKTLFSQIESYWTQATTSQAKFRAAQSNVESMTESYDLLQEQFRLGLKNIADLLSSRGNLLTAQQTMLQDKYTTVLNRSLLEFYSDGQINL